MKNTHPGCADVFTPHHGVTMARPESPEQAAADLRALGIDATATTKGIEVKVPDTLAEAIKKAQERK